MPRKSRFVTQFVGEIRQQIRYFKAGNTTPNQHCAELEDIAKRLNTFDARKITQEELDPSKKRGKR